MRGKAYKDYILEDWRIQIKILLEDRILKDCRIQNKTLEA